MVYALWMVHTRVRAIYLGSQASGSTAESSSSIRFSAKAMHTAENMPARSFRLICTRWQQIHIDTHMSEAHTCTYRLVVRKVLGALVEEAELRVPALDGRVLLEPACADTCIMCV